MEHLVNLLLLSVEGSSETDNITHYTLRTRILDECLIKYVQSSCENYTKKTFIYQISNSRKRDSWMHSILPSRRSSITAVYQGCDIISALRTLDRYPIHKSKVASHIIRCKIFDDVSRSSSVYEHLISNLTDGDYKDLVITILQQNLPREGTKNVPRLRTSKFSRPIKLDKVDITRLLGYGDHVTAVSLVAPPSYEEAILQTSQYNSKVLSYSYSEPHRVLSYITLLTTGVVDMGLLEKGVIPVGTWIFFADVGTKLSNVPPVELLCTSTMQAQDVISRITSIQGDGVISDYGNITVVDTWDIQWIIYTMPEVSIVPYMLLSTDMVFMTIKNGCVQLLGMPSYHLTRMSNIVLANSCKKSITCIPSQILRRKLEVCLEHLQVLVDISQIATLEVMFPGLSSENL